MVKVLVDHGIFVSAANLLKMKRFCSQNIRKVKNDRIDAIHIASYCLTYGELYYHFGAEVADCNENGKLLKEELRQREEINELIVTEDCIEMTYHLQYCENCQNDHASLLSVLGCNIYDEHGLESAENPSCEEHPQTHTM